jgi:cytochrome c2
MKRKSLSRVEFRKNEMADLIAYIRTQGSRAEKVYLSPGDPRSGEKLFEKKGCRQCHSSGGESDLSKRQDFPRTMGQFAGKMWNHSGEMREGRERRGIRFPTLSSQEMSDLVAYLFFTRYFDEPGDPERGSGLFLNKQCNLCHTKKSRTLDLSDLKGQISPILMAQAMWNHGAKMLEGIRKLRTPWYKIDGREMVDLIEYLHRGIQ